MNRLKRLPLSIAIVGLAGISTSAVAEGMLALEEIVVTAQKRAQDMQDVPIAVTAMSAEMIKEAGIDAVGDVALRTPGFSMATFNPSQPQLYIRGIGSNLDGAGGGEQSVAVFLDGVYINRSSGTGTELYDLESIEVLRGPQGTLWGKNAIAGAINLTSKRPSDQLQSSLEIGVGNLGYTSYRGMVSGPVSDNVLGKISFNRKDQEGYVESAVNPDIETGDINSSSVRGQLLFLPSEDLEVLLSMDYGTDRRNGMAAIPDSDQGLMGMFLANPALPEADFYENYVEDPGYTDMNSKGLSIQVDWDRDWGTFTSLTAYRENETAFSNILLGVGLTAFPALGIDNFAEESGHMLSQEFRISGETDSLIWQAGLYYNREKTRRVEGGEFTTVLDLPTLLTTGAVVPLGSVVPLGTDVGDQSNETNSVAVFGQATYALTNDLDVTFGMRYTREKKEATSDASAGAGLYAFETFKIDVEETWAAPTFKLVANYRFNDDIMVYLSAATGFKSGGFDGSASTEALTRQPFDEEKALNIELGFKSMLRGQRLRLNGALFNTSYKDLQTQQTYPDPLLLVPPLSVKNAGEAVSRGIELEAVLAVTESLQLSASYAYLDTEYKKLDGNLEPYEGNKLRNAPRIAYNLAATYTHNFDDGASLNARLEYITKDRVYEDVENFEYSSMPDYQITNMRLAYTPASETWELAAWAKNVFDEEYFVHNFQVAPFGAVHVPAMPRTYGLNLTLQF